MFQLAGAQGEFAGMLAIKKAHEAKGEGEVQIVFTLTQRMELIRNCGNVWF